MRRAFSLVELMIVVSVLGILAAIVVPQYRDYTTRAKEAAAKQNLAILRGAIERYAQDHGVPPGYPGNDVTESPSQWVFIMQLAKSSNSGGQLAEPRTAGYPYGPYLSEPPVNPFNRKKTVFMIGNGDTFPAEAVEGDWGWVYQPATKNIRLNQPGPDSEEVRHFDY